jgi:hypothetical protein
MNQEKLFAGISRSHHFWRRKHTNGLIKIFKDIGPEDILFDLSSGGYAHLIFTLQHGTRVIAGDIDPVAVFLSKILIQPISLFALKQAFEDVRGYLPANEYSKSHILSDHWYPSGKIKSLGKTGERFVHEFFTKPDLKTLAKLLLAINKISSRRCRQALQYVFTNTLYTCSTKQDNVWKAFENEFNAFLKCKTELNSMLGFVRISNSMDEFENSNDAAYIPEEDLPEISFPRKLNVTHVFIGRSCIDPYFIKPGYSKHVGHGVCSEFYGAWLKMDFGKM